jgi:hypothetical protein
MKIFVALLCLLFVEVTATITKEGPAAKMRVAPGPPPALSDPVKETLAKWRFTGCP